MAIKNLNVTIGAGITRVCQPSIRCNCATFSNRSAHEMAVGGPDVTTGANGLGIDLTTGGTNFAGRQYIAQTNLAFWYVAGTQNDVLSITYDDGVDNLA